MPAKQGPNWFLLLITKRSHPYLFSRHPNCTFMAPCLNKAITNLLIWQLSLEPKRLVVKGQLLLLFWLVFCLFGHLKLDFNVVPLKIYGLTNFTPGFDTRVTILAIAGISRSYLYQVKRSLFYQETKFLNFDPNLPASNKREVARVDLL